MQKGEGLYVGESGSRGMSGSAQANAPHDLCRLAELLRASPRSGSRARLRKSSPAPMSGQTWRPYQCLTRHKSHFRSQRNFQVNLGVGGPCCRRAMESRSNPNRQQLGRRNNTTASEGELLWNCCGLSREPGTIVQKIQEQILSSTWAGAT